MGRVVDFGHPTVELKFRTIETVKVDDQGRVVPGENYSLLVQVQDALTGEILMAENLKGTAEWLKALGYRYLSGSKGVWHQ